MKHATRVLGTLAVVMMTSLTMVTALQAQNHIQLKANIPFDFYVGDKKLPAGNYIVTQPGIGALWVIGDHGSTPIFTSRVSNRDKSMEPMLIFNKYTPDQVFLSEVRWLGNPMAAKVQQSELEQDIAGNAPAKRVIAAAKNR